jgi:3-oxoacyl-[acyl-carrier protein] reductase
MVALITGAAHGIGRAIGNRMAESGLKIVIADINRIVGERVRKSIIMRGGEAVFIKVDLRNIQEIKLIVEETIAHYGRLDILVNNARPILHNLDFVESLSEWDLAMDVLLKAPVQLVRYALPHLTISKNAHIINISSTNAHFISHQSIAYHVAKAGLEHLTRYLACELGPKGICVNSVSPGLVDIHDDGKPLTGNSLNKTITKLAVPLKRAATPEEIAEAVMFFCSAPSYITGQVLTLDGGVTLNDHFQIARKAYLAGLEKRQE